MQISSLFASRFFFPLVVLLMCFAPFAADPYSQYVLNLVLVYIVIAIGQVIILGFTGQFAFANAAFMGIGAYTCTLLMADLGVSFWLAFPAAAVTCATIAALVGMPVLRLSRVYLSIVTLAFGELCLWIFLHWKVVTHGTDGVSMPSPVLFGYTLYGDVPSFYIILAVTAVLVWLGKRILTSRYGRAFIAIRENEQVAECFGIDYVRYKTLAFVISAVYAGIGGVLFAVAIRYINPPSFGMLQLVIHFAMVMVGGYTTFAGAIIGATLLTVLPEALRGFEAAQEMVYGAILVFFIVFMSKGIAGFLINRGILPPEILVHGWRDELKRGASLEPVVAKIPVGEEA